MGGWIPVIAGITSTIMFAASALPMVVKAARTRDMGSYSLGHLVLSNVGNLFHTFYVFSLPPGPIWVLHAFYLVTAAFMLAWYLRHAHAASRPPSGVLGIVSPQRAAAAARRRGTVDGRAPARG